MRKREKHGGLTVVAISGLHVVTLAMDVSENKRKGLLGFAVHRTDHTENDAYWINGFKTFYSVEPKPVGGIRYSTRNHPIQSFQWGDYTAKPDHRYTYKVVALYDQPANPSEGATVSLTLRTESANQGTHTIYFNRGVAGSQAYADKFQNRTPDEVPELRAYKWLSRGLEEAILAFIGRAKDQKDALRAAVYEFNHAPVLQAFKDAHKRCKDVKIVYDARKDNPRKSSEEAIRKAGIAQLMKKRVAGKSYISHNKFIVHLRNGKPVAVWTGSTNFTKGGIFGQSNVGHVIEDAAIAKAYHEYWKELYDDTTPRDLRKWNESYAPVPSGEPKQGITAIFSPRTDLKALEWYAGQLDHAGNSAHLTAAFGVNPKLAVVLKKDKTYPRFLLVEKTGDNYRDYTHDRNVNVSVGSFLKTDILDRWTKEGLTNLNVHVRFVHTKYMLLDPLSDDPIVITGSANFSDASVKNNDENMVVIRGDTRVADMFIGEFMRLFNHFYFRYHANRLHKSKPTAEDRKHAFLVEDDTWTRDYFKSSHPKCKRRLLFTQTDI